MELHTANLARACGFYTGLFGWRAEKIDVGSRSYLALDLGNGIEGGMVECSTTRPVWLPYVEVPDLAATTEQARGLEARVLLEPREGPAGWRSVIAPPDGAEIALWQPKQR
jgi:predicted enzyme related to lactoylglutathione lyase